MNNWLESIYILMKYHALAKNSVEFTVKAHGSYFMECEMKYD